MNKKKINLEITILESDLQFILDTFEVKTIEDLKDLNKFNLEEFCSTYKSMERFTDMYQ